MTVAYGPSVIITLIPAVHEMYLYFTAVRFLLFASRGVMICANILRTVITVADNYVHKQNDLVL